jgi:hypothetical protein
MRSLISRSSTAGVLGAFAWATLYCLGRTWGTTSAERLRHLPGDDLICHPLILSDHATTIQGRPHDVWPWLIQMGWGRGGFYTYRWVDRLFFPANPPSADSVRPEFQSLAIGDRIPDGPPESACFYQVEVLEPSRMLVLRSWTHLPPRVRRIPDVRMEWTWGFYLDEIDECMTRLHFRVRGRLEPWWLLALYRAVIVPADFVMGRSFCLGMKKRVERAAAPTYGTGVHCAAFDEGEYTSAPPSRPRTAT